MSHDHDSKRWNETSKVNVPLYSTTQNATYNGAHDAYENDYLFFGQHLDKTNADAYPVHISSVAKGDAVDAMGISAKGGNRVYKATAYYQNATKDNFLYNKDAWALHPLLTAIDFTEMVVEGDGATTIPATFSVDSNKDYDADGTPIAAGTYTNASKGHVTQNLLVYNSGEPVFDKKDAAGIAEKDVVYHNIVKTGETFAADYLHLVDKQEFWCPIAFNVSTRAWYERLPHAYRNVQTLGYDKGSAWEGIVLPFTATKVTASTNGEISHFYETDELNHEYWLRGLTGVDASASSVVAAFMQPALSAKNGFAVDAQGTSKIPNYLYRNTYFANIPTYDRSENFGKHYYDAAHGGVTYTDYIPLTAGVPYIVSFPGNDFYEFSMEGDGSYSTSTHDKTGNGQWATFETGATTIPVTISAMNTTEGGYKHVGTFLHTACDYGINDGGSAFDDAVTSVVPFRTYMVQSANPAPHRIKIAYGAEPAVEEKDDVDGPAFQIVVDGMDVTVESTYEQSVPVTVHTVAGQLVIRHEAKPGTTHFRLPKSGVYIIGGKRYLVR